jgi:hypothetical protein
MSAWHCPRMALSSFCYSLDGRSNDAATAGAVLYDADYENIHQHSAYEYPAQQHDGRVYPLPIRSLKDATCKNEWHGSSQSLSSLSSFPDWQMPSRDFKMHAGWVEHTLPNNDTYFHHPQFHAITDVNLDDRNNLDAVVILLNRLEGEGILPLEDWELWLQDAETSKYELSLVHVWVHHKSRIISSERSPRSSEIRITKDQSQFTSLGYHFYH